MSRLLLSTNLNIDLAFDTAPFLKRLFAWAIDFFIFVVYFYVVVKTMGALPKEMQEDEYWIFMILLLPIALYHVVLESTLNGQTLGKRLMHIKVINENGGNATLSQFVIRWMLRISDFILMIMMIVTAMMGYAVAKEMLFVTLLAITDIFCVALTKKAQRLGDMAAGTILIKTNAKSNLEETVFMETTEDYIVQYPEVMRLSDRDINMIKSIYDSLKKKYNNGLAERTSEKITNALQIKARHLPLEFFEVLLKDYNYLSTK